MAVPQYVKHERIWLRDHPQFDEAWLQGTIASDPSILGLGDLVLLDRERRQERGGRLDLLLSDDELSERFEVEIQLGTTDASHIIRTIEYWDVERRRYPAYEHTAVLVAEDVTSRFLNLLGLFAGAIPLVVLQLNALLVEEDKLVLDIVRVLDQRSLRNDDEADVKLTQTDRAYWEKRGSARTVALADDVLAILNEGKEQPFSLNFNKHYIGLNDGVRSRNFLSLGPRKSFLRVAARLADPSAWIERLEDAGIEASVRKDRLRVTITGSELKSNRELLAELLNAAATEAFE